MMRQTSDISHGACHSRQSVHNGGALLPNSWGFQIDSLQPRSQGSELLKAGQQNIDKPAALVPAGYHFALHPQAPSGSSSSAIDRERRSPTHSKLAPLDESISTSSASSSSSLPISVTSVSEALDRTPFLTMSAKFKLLEANDNCESTADALSTLRRNGRIKTFQQVSAAGHTYFAVELL